VLQRSNYKYALGLRFKTVKTLYLLPTSKEAGGENEGTWLQAGKEFEAG
jgi:hypothetical protein